MKLHNTLTRNNDELFPLNDKKVSLYTCGLTVYSQPHIGNWVAYIYWDILVRALKAEGYEVTRVQNITDVGHLTSDEDAGEDKMEKGARKEGITAWDVAEKYIKIAEHEAYDMLGLLKPDHMPRATEYIPQQIAFVEALEKKGYTYVIDDGVYFDTSKLANYGSLARLDIDGLKAGARVDADGKKNPTDFALWKLSPKGTKRDMEWESPWGIGFPGWHLECSVMARELLGDQIDIHTGGIDHIQVHHTNEIAQTEAVTEKPFASIWVHANHIKVDGTKMSKSLSNVYTLQDILDHGFSLDAFKLMILSKSYKKEGNFTWNNLQNSQNLINTFQLFSDKLHQVESEIIDSNEFIDIEDLNKYLDQIKLYLFDDLDTHSAIMILSDILTYLNGKSLSIKDTNPYKYFLKQLDDLLNLGLGTIKPIDDNIIKNVSSLKIEYPKSRITKDYSQVDKLKNELDKMHISISISSSGLIRWHRKVYAEMTANLNGTSGISGNISSI